MPIKTLKLEQIILDAGTDVRDEINEGTVNEYGEAYKSKAKMPPLIVFDTGDEAGLVLSDGFHRYYGLERQGFKDAQCDVRKGTRLEALQFALGCNTTHGLRRTNEDKRHAVTIALKEFPEHSTHQLADMCAVSRPLVDEVRKSIVPSAPPAQSPSGGNSAASAPPKRRGKDGKTYSAPKRSASPSSAPPAPVKHGTMDATGIRVPEEIVEFWDSSIVAANELLGKISDIRTQIKSAQQNDHPMYREILFADVLGHLDNSYAELKRMKPFAVCPQCNGILTNTSATVKKTGAKVASNEHCTMCKGRGFVSEFYWNNCVAEEIKITTGRQ